MVNFENLKLILMRKTVILLFCSLSFITNFAQTVSQKLQAAFKQFENDPQLKYAISSLYVIDAATGKVVFDKNSSVGLAPASTQKIITAATAFSVLGKEYRYKTEFIIRKNLHLDRNPDLRIKSSFDPTLGSTRYSNTIPQAIYSNVLKTLQDNSIKGITRIVIPQYIKDQNPLPEGYIWNDIGNYFGAASFAVNWRENQYDLLLRSDKSKVDIIGTEPQQRGIEFKNFLSVGAEGSGDNAYIYAVPFSKETVLRGTIPPNQNKFIISGSLTDPAKTMGQKLFDFLNKNKISFSDTIRVNSSTEVFKDSFTVERDMSVEDLLKTNGPKEEKVMYTHYSPTLDSIIYWFLQKSINLYGEAIVKTLAYQTKGNGNTNDGIQIIKDFWKTKGIDENELNIGDGSGLSPQNRVTTHAQVEVLKYAKTQSWYDAYYKAFPEYNGMKMKSGTIKDVKGFCGYHKAADGKEYIFSFLVNNYNGSSSALTNKMFRVLNVLK